jgi:hypothetical protein
MARRRRVLLGALRFFAWLVPGLALGGMALGLLTWLWLRTASGNDWLLGQLLPLLQPSAGAIEVTRLRSDLWEEVSLEGVVLRDPEGVALISVGHVDADVALQSLIGRVVPIRDLRLEGVDVQLDDPAVFRRMWPSDPTKPATPWAGLPVEVLVDRLSVSGRVSVKGQTFEGLSLVGAVTARRKQVSWTGLQLDATGLGGPVHLEGSLPPRSASAPPPRAGRTGSACMGRWSAKHSRWSWTPSTLISPRSRPSFPRRPRCRWPPRST